MPRSTTPSTLSSSSAFLFDKTCRWIWSKAATRPYNNFVCFRRSLDVRAPGGQARLRITADSRYEVYLNGEWIGHGPPRSWSSPWTVDEYDLAGLLRPGANTLAVLVQHFGIGTFQYLHEAPGLIAELEWTDGRKNQRLGTDATWKAIPNAAFAWPVPRIACQQAWEEQFDARKAPADVHGRDWRDPDFNDASWPAAAIVRKPGEPPHEAFELRDIPFLTRQSVEPFRVLAVETVRPARYVWSLLPRDLVAPSDKTANQFRCRLLFVTHIHSDRPQTAEIQAPHDIYLHPGTPWKLNGKTVEFLDRTRSRTDSGTASVKLKKGWNILMGRMPLITHHLHLILNINTEHPVRFQCRPGAAAAQSPWLMLGPFEVTKEEVAQVKWIAQIVAESVEPEATIARFDAIWERGIPTDADLRASFAQPVPAAMIAPADAFAICASDNVLPAAPRVEEPEALRFDNADWTVVHPDAKGGSVRFLFDYGNEVIGYQEIELDAPAGTLVDFHNFEFIQRDGRFNLAEGMNNSMRYVCRDGVQTYRSFLRRGFRYSYITIREFNRPVRVRRVRALMNSYPVAQKGDFACSDPMLDRIWHAGAHTVRCCAEDTYTDCPTYEQTHWVGDARNEAMVDLVANGDPRLSRHCWIQAARSLQRSDLVESHVPSAWPTILPAWTFLWMRWAHEHYLLTGDKPLAREMLVWLKRNNEGIESYIADDGIFSIAAWNMFDWAAMDTPHDRSAVTHQNCLAVLGLRQAAELARLLAQSALAKRWDGIGDRLAAAINKHLWCDAKKAYYDCIHEDGKPSTVFSQQTQTAAYIAGVATGERAKRCREIIRKPPKGFTSSGTPFFMFFVLEGLVREGRDRELIDTIRSYWGRQIDAGATTIWEIMHPDEPRMTRSHCHGWSSAPTYFLSIHVLGVQPMEPGFAKIRVAPKPGTLTWAHGKVPTPRGVVECCWRNEKDGFFLRLVAPANTPVRIELPLAGTVETAEGKIRKVASPKGTLHLDATGPVIVLSVKRD